MESMRLFSVSGFDAVSVRSIASAVGVSDGALYKHFKSKQAIFDAIVEQSKQRFFEQYGKIQQEFVNLDETSFEDMCLSMFRFQTQPQELEEIFRIHVRNFTESYFVS